MTDASKLGVALEGGRRVRDARTPVLAALVMTLALAALDSTVVTTAVPSIVHNLGGFNLFPWLFSIYLLTQAVTVPIYGRLADIFGRRPMIFTGIGLFLVGSIACGLAWNMASLIAFRGLQGLGAGAIIPLVQTVVGDLYTVRERARITGYTASVWGIASVLGPLMGGVLSQYASWRWIFYLNLPIGVVALYLVRRYLHETITRRSERIDHLGAVLLTIGLTGLIFAILEGGSAWAWSSATELVILLSSLAVLGAFIVVERRSAEPMVPSWILSRRPLLFGNISALAVGAILLGLTSYIPTWAQGVRHLDPLVSGLTVASITLGWPVASALSGKVYLRIGFRGAAFIGTLVAIAGAWTFTWVRPSTPILLVALFGIFVGAGMGLASTPVMVGLSTLVGWERRGVVTASNLFARTIGSAVGIAIFGSVANSSLSRWLREAPPSVSRLMPNSGNVASSVLGGGKVSLAPKAAAYVRSGLYHATHDVFVCVVFVGVLGALAVAAMPRHLTTLEFDDEPAPIAEDPVSSAASVMPVAEP